MDHDDHDDDDDDENDHNDYRNDPVLRPLFELGMKQQDLPRHKNLPRASILVLLFRFRRGGDHCGGGGKDAAATTTGTTHDNNNKNNHRDDDDEWHVLLTQRPLHLKSHPGEVCLPGGRQEDSDRGDDVTTALRETMEEVGIGTGTTASKKKEIVPVARMETIESVGGLCVTPIIAIWTKPVPPRRLAQQVCRDEVEAVFYTPLSYFWNDDHCHGKQELEWRGGIFTMRTYYWKDRNNHHHQNNLQAAGSNNKEPPRVFKIWGLTAHVVHEVAQLCHPKHANTTTTTTAASINDNSNDNNNSSSRSNDASSSLLPLSGPLYRLMDDSTSSTRRQPYWALRYFVLAENANNAQTPRVLHQYDSEQKATSKAGTATKKNRLLLEDHHTTCHPITTTDNDDEKVDTIIKGDKKYPFKISVLDGRIEWTLAASSEGDRDKWLSGLLESLSISANNKTGSDHNTGPSSKSSNKKLKSDK